MMCALAVASLLSTVALGGTPDNRLNAVAKP
jgi:hypothetical protein